MQLYATDPLPAAENNESIFQRVYRAVAVGAGAPVVRIQVKPYVNTMGKLRLAAGVLDVLLSDVIASAPATVREALAWILVSKLFRKQPPPHWSRHFRQYMNRSEVRRVQNSLRVARGRKYITGPQGRCHNLDVIYDSLRDRYFNPLMPKPQLGWSRRPSRSLLGHFDHAHFAIVLSSILDRAGVPRFVVEYVLYHEMLHLKHPVEHRSSRRTVHSKAFHEDEKQFERFAEAKAFLKAL